jgi:type VI secretion system ImpC/EvpB family protein
MPPRPPGFPIAALPADPRERFRNVANMSAGAEYQGSADRVVESIETTSPATAPSGSPPLQHWLWDHLKESSAAQRDSGRLQQFLGSETVGQALTAWLGSSDFPERDRLARQLNQDVAAIDKLVSDQLQAILHAPSFQKLEASWRGLRYLTERAVEEDDTGQIEIRVLNASWRELERDFERAIEFDQSQLFRKIYEDEFGKPGGHPFGLLLGDYEIHPRVTPDHPHNDMTVLQHIAQVAAAAFCPFVAAASPTMFGLDDFSDLERTLDHERTFTQLDYLQWNNFRRMEESRFVGLVLPRALMRLPYDVDCSEEFRNHPEQVRRFHFREDVTGSDRSKYLWGNAAFAFGGVVIRAYARSGWFADIRGVQRNTEGGGIVTSLPVHSFGTDKLGVAVKSSTDVVITDVLEKQLSELGFLALCDCHDTEYSAFYSTHSVQKPARYDRPEASRNAEISARLQYMLCVSRFAHYIKVLARAKVGAYHEAQEFEHYLHDWLFRYVTSDAEASPEAKARHPLREAQVQVTDMPGKPGAFQCIMHLSPHFELDQVVASVRLATELSPPRIP